MAVTSSSNVSSFIYPDFLKCFRTTSGSMSLTIFTVTNAILLFPLCILILYVGVQRRRHQQTRTTTTSHSDVFTYHMVVMEIIGVAGSICFCRGIYSGSLLLTKIGLYLFCLTYTGQTYFHSLTCVERYLAVAHAITYMRLRQSGGVRIRNISIGCVWLLCSGWVGVAELYYPEIPNTLFTVTFAFSLIIVSFCSLSVLRVLIGLGLGKVGGNRERIDQTKLRAFHTVMAILGVLLLRCCALMVSNILLNLNLVNGEITCMMLPLGMWFCVPSSLVLPLLFLQKAGKLSCSGHMF